MFGGMKWLHPFLAVSQPVGGEVLVVEGWLPDYAIRHAVELSRQRGYRTLVVTGVDIEKGAHLTVQTNYAQIGASTLKHFGFDEKSIVELPSHDIQKNRTYTTALAVKEWISRHPGQTRLDVFTLGPHARRSRLLYQMAFAGSCEIGVISSRDEDYDPARWWTTSQGFRTTVGEVIAYGYVRVLFSP